MTKTDTYWKILNALGLTYQKDQLMNLLEQEIGALHCALLYFQQKECLVYIEAMIRKLETAPNEISCMNIKVFLLKLHSYFSEHSYLSEGNIDAFMQFHTIFKEELSEIICFYCVCSCAKISNQIERTIYEKYSELQTMDYLPIKVYLMKKYRHDYAFEEMILLGKKIKDEAKQSKNKMILYEYYSCMANYYIQNEPVKALKALEKMRTIAAVAPFPLIKKKQFYKNYASYCMKKRNYAAALPFLYRMLEIPEQHCHSYADVVINILFCESQLMKETDLSKFKKMNEQYFSSKAEYRLYCYFCEKNKFSDEKKLNYLEKQILPCLTFHDHIARYQVKEELSLLPDTKKKWRLFYLLQQ